MSMHGGAAVAAMIQAIKASGVVVRMEPMEFNTLLGRQEQPLVVHAMWNWLFGMSHQYLMSYKGLAFYTKSSMPLMLPKDAELVEARSIWIPG
jgi:hypothetical protein